MTVPVTAPTIFCKTQDPFDPSTPRHLLKERSCRLRHMFSAPGEERDGFDRGPLAQARPGRGGATL